MMTPIVLVFAFVASYYGGGMVIVEADSKERCEVARAALSVMQPQTDAARDVLAERERQQSVEGWTHKHDDEHDGGELAIAAVAYAQPATWPLRNWPWGGPGPKRKTRRHDLVVAAALLIAEIERIDRASPPKVLTP